MEASKTPAYEALLSKAGRGKKRTLKEMQGDSEELEKSARNVRQSRKVTQKKSQLDDSDATMGIDFEEKDEEIKVSAAKGKDKFGTVNSVSKL